MGVIKVARVGAVDVIELNRPDAGNRITQELGEELVKALNAARRNPDVHGCVLTGHGDVFCLGGDFRGAGDHISNRMEFARAHIDVFTEMARLGKPLIAAVNGNAHAGGLSLALACDMIYMAEDATIGLPEMAHGLFPLLALAIARDALPKAILFDIIYNARLLNAMEASALHLTSRVMPKAQVVSEAIKTVEAATRGNRNVLTLGRDLFYAMRGQSPEAALDQARLALTSALSATDKAK